MKPGQRDSNTSLWVHVVAGAGARATCETFMSPLNLIKVRLQHSFGAFGKSSLTALPTMVYRLFQAEGIVGAFKGLPPRLLWSTPLSSFMFCYYEEVRSMLGLAPGQQQQQQQQQPHGSPDGQTLQAGRTPKQRDWATADFAKRIMIGPALFAVGTAVRTPFDIIEQHLQIAVMNEGEAGRRLQGRAILSRIYEAEGVRGLYRGASASYLSGCGYLACYFCSYETSKWLLGAKASGRPDAATLLAGGLAGFLSAGVTCPLDTVRTTMQTNAVHQPAGGPYTYPGVWATTRTIVNAQGAAALFSGIGPRLASHTTAGTIIFGAYELYKHMLSRPKRGGERR